MPVNIHSLPPEIIARILEQLCSNSRHTITLPPPQPGVIDVVSFSQICGRWRSIAISHRRLWTKYSVDFRLQMTRPQFRALLSALNLFTERAKDQSLDYTMIQNASYIKPRLFIAFLVESAPFLRSLELIVCYEIAAAFSFAPAIPFERLQRFRMRMSPHVRGSMTDPPLDHRFPSTTKFFTNSPLLTDVEIGYYGWQPTRDPGLQFLEWNFPLHQLSEFRSINTYLEADECIHLLVHCPNLVVCRMGCDAIVPRLELETTPHILHKLRDLHIIFRVLHSWLWPYFTAPNLTDLTLTSLSDDDDGEHWDNEQFTAFKERSSCSLRSLALQFDFSHFTDEIIEVLDTSPTLEFLELRWKQLDSKPSRRLLRLLDRLSRHPGSSLWLPNLRTIRLDANRTSMAMLRSRFIPTVAREDGVGGPTPSITLYAAEPFDPRTLFPQDIGALKAAGVSITILPTDFYGAQYLDNPDSDSESESESENDEEMTDGDGDSEEEDVDEGERGDEMDTAQGLPGTV